MSPFVTTLQTYKVFYKTHALFSCYFLLIFFWSGASQKIIYYSLFQSMLYSRPQNWLSLKLLPNKQITKNINFLTKYAVYSPTKWIKKKCTGHRFKATFYSWISFNSRNLYVIKGTWGDKRGSLTDTKVNFFNLSSVDISPRFYLAL